MSRVYVPISVPTGMLAGWKLMHVDKQAWAWVASIHTLFQMDVLTKWTAVWPAEDIFPTEPQLLILQFF